MASDSRGAAETTPTLARYGRNFCSAVHNVTVVLTRFVASGAEMLHGRRRQHRWYPSLRQRRQLCVVLLVEVFGAISGHVRRRQQPPVQLKLKAPATTATQGTALMSTTPHPTSDKRVTRRNTSHYFATLLGVITFRTCRPRQNSPRDS